MLRPLSTQSAARLARQFKSQGKKIVFTNGCFDLLHPGHVKILEFAKSQGDVLFLGLNSDASIRRLKGPGRPVLPLLARAKLVLALRAVDFVVPFAQSTPLKLIAAIGPDVLVKGADWPAKQIVGRKYARRIVRVPLASGFSTTSLIRKIRAGR
ncbi:MAG: adenylyltransferase/cytidyltransferase family protein [Elusimicrobiota bacterium]